MSRRPTPSHRHADVEQRRAEIIAEIVGLGLPLPGSLVERRTRCANRNCRCRADPPRLHGPYLAWTRKVDGKTITRSMRTDQADRYGPWLDNARRLHELVTELEQLAVQQAETTEGWPPT